MSPSKSQMVQWSLSLSDCVILDMDGSVLGNLSRGSFGGCLQNAVVA